METGHGRVRGKAPSDGLELRKEDDAAPGVRRVISSIRVILLHLAGIGGEQVLIEKALEDNPVPTPFVGHPITGGRLKIRSLDPEVGRLLGCEGRNSLANLVRLCRVEQG